MATKKQVTLKRSGNVDLWKVLLNGSAVAFNSGSASVKLAPGQHTLQWFVRGGVGASYALEITAPPESILKHTAVLDASEKDGGHAWFTVGP